MTKPSTLLLLAFLAVGCKDNPYGPAPAETAPPQGELAIAVNVTGDASTAPDSFYIFGYGSPWIAVPPNKVVRRRVNVGPYELSLAPVSAALGLTSGPIWCINLAPHVQPVVVEKGLLQTVAFSVECPPLVGAGQLTVTVSLISGSKIRAVPVTVSRTTKGPQYSRTIEVPANESLTVPLAVGVLQVAPTSGSGCSAVYPTTVPFLFPGWPPTIALRNGEVGVVTLRVWCN